MGRLQYLSATAEISSDGRYRYALSRQLRSGKRAVLFVGLNPSTADEATDDPTVRRCVRFAGDWEFDWLFMGNLHALRATNPQELKRARDPVGHGNADALRALASRSELVVAAWGAHWLHPSAQRLASWVESLEQARCLGQNRDGSPKHPLYLPAHTAVRRLTDNRR